MIKKTLFILLLTTATAQAENLRKVELVRVIDGDTIEVTYTTAIRLNNVDCFENKPNDRQKWQAGKYDLKEEEVIAKGKESEKRLSELLAGNENNLYLQVKGLDKYRRTLGKLYIGKDKQVDINEFMLKGGGCLPYQPRPHKRKKGG